jgi:hypothetical protein
MGFRYVIFNSKEVMSSFYSCDIDPNNFNEGPNYTNFEKILLDINKLYSTLNRRFSEPIEINNIK